MEGGGGEGGGGDDAGAMEAEEDLFYAEMAAHT